MERAYSFRMSTKWWFLGKIRKHVKLNKFSLSRTSMVLSTSNADLVHFITYIIVE